MTVNATTVVVYCKEADPYSARAKNLLQRKGVEYIEKRVPEHSAEMLRITSSTETPQIVVNGKPIGGFEELGRLELLGELDALLFE
jgi:glutaredoxin 3